MPNGDLVRLETNTGSSVGYNGYSRKEYADLPRTEREALKKFVEEEIAASNTRMQKHLQHHHKHIAFLEKALRESCANPKTSTVLGKCPECGSNQLLCMYTRGMG